MQNARNRYAPLRGMFKEYMPVMIVEELARRRVDERQVDTLTLETVEPLVVRLRMLDVITSDNDTIIVVQRDEPPIERPIVKGVEQQTIRSRSLLDRRGCLPRFDMTGKQQRSELNSSDTAGATIVLQQRVAEVRLVDTLQCGDGALVAKKHAAGGFEMRILIRCVWAGDVCGTRQCISQQLDALRQKSVAIRGIPIPDQGITSLLPCDMPTRPRACRLASCAAIFQILSATEFAERFNAEASRCTSSPLSSHSLGSRMQYSANAIIVSSRDQLRRGRAVGSVRLMSPG